MKLAIIGTAGVPARYGGFETLAQNLVHFAEQKAPPEDTITVYCSDHAYPQRNSSYHGASLRYSRFNANGAQSVIYDVMTALDATFRKHDRILVLGVSGAIIIPFLRLISRTQIITNVDGIEWRREKWQGFARRFLKFSEKLAVRYSHQVIADNQGIADHLKETYQVDAKVIAYGGDHALLNAGGNTETNFDLPDQYALSLCRIEPENNVEMILEGFSKSDLPLVFVGNWTSSDYGNDLRLRYGDHPNLHLLDPVYEEGALFVLRSGVKLYVHGHSAGGTNPSLVEMMHFGVPIFAFDCTYNRYTTEDEASYFSNAEQLELLIENPNVLDKGPQLQAIADRQYRWDDIGEAYFNLMREAANEAN